MRPNPSTPRFDPDMPGRADPHGLIVAVTLLAGTASAVMAGPIAAVVVAVWERLS